MQAADLSADSPMGVILKSLPGAKRAIFARYHLGGCQSCAFSNEETLAELCARSEIPADEVLAHLLASHVHDSAMWMEPAVAQEQISGLRLIDLRTREEHEAVVIPVRNFSPKNSNSSSSPESPAPGFCYTTTAARTCSTKSRGSAAMD
jgi:hypothetical protein